MGRSAPCIRLRDPAARSELETLLTYPGVHALSIAPMGQIPSRRNGGLGRRSLVKVKLSGLKIAHARGKYYVYLRATGETLLRGFAHRHVLPLRDVQEPAGPLPSGDAGASRLPRRPRPVLDPATMERRGRAKRKCRPV
jgi:hypothetical protein